ncbi:hypothetical protein B0H11DRAFT_1744953, partial [Mycena galericulata]
LLRLSTHSRKEAKLADQLRAMTNVLDSFGNAELIPIQMTPGTKLLALHYNDCGRFAGAKCLVSGLVKSRLARLGHAERTYHVQLPYGGDHHGAHLQLEDPSEYALLASSGTDRLPSGPFYDDTTAISDLRVALRVLSFQPTPPVLPLPSAALMSTNITFLPADNHCEGATVSPASFPAFQLTIRLLGIPRDRAHEPHRKEPRPCAPRAARCTTQRTVILVAFLLESYNRRAASHWNDHRRAAPHARVRRASSRPAFDVFVSNFCDELGQGWVAQTLFSDQDDVVGNEACVDPELLRGILLVSRQLFQARRRSVL